ncbi:12185_t:CDS:2 [Funneliformis geosporum]|uniref:13014_t:CDS:1 n=1 Tax=Funneliformis geosporum TaxID=1117311 RepID=A0A9W4WW04_9GLOM|nr:13014_t:CDS:2 [Funneliformis geosporum]CAI2187183.1 12185_t:CDS:2 [Funneliformis geosporum]
MGKFPLFTQAENKIILECMQRNPNNKSYMIIKKELEQVSSNKDSKQIRHHWTNYLNPELCKVPLDDEKKAFLVRWIEQNNMQNGNFPIMKLVDAMYKEYNLLYSENSIKNFLHTRKRRQRRLDRTQESHALRTSETRPQEPCALPTRESPQELPKYLEPPYGPYGPQHLQHLHKISPSFD